MRIKNTLKLIALVIGVLLPIFANAWTWSSRSGRYNVWGVNISNGTQKQERTRTCNASTQSYSWKWTAACPFWYVVEWDIRAKSYYCKYSNWTKSPARAEACRPSGNYGCASSWSYNWSFSETSYTCSGSSKETRTINVPINWGWTAWSEWKQGLMAMQEMRTRSCTNPTPLNGWADCVWDSVEVRTKWPTWSAWSERKAVWEINPATWEQTEERYRTCNSGSGITYSWYGASECPFGTTSIETWTYDFYEVYCKISPDQDGYTVLAEERYEWTSSWLWTNKKYNWSFESTGSSTTTPKEYSGFGCWTCPFGTFEVGTEQIWSGGSFFVGYPYNTYCKVSSGDSTTRASNWICTIKQESSESSQPWSFTWTTSSGDCIWDSKETRTVTKSVNWGWSDWSKRTPIGTLNEEGEYAEVNADGSILHERTRTCTNPAPLNGWANCTWDSRETAMRFLALDWGWWEWGPWAETKRWENGWKLYLEVQRTRACDDPAPANGWEYCPIVDWVAETETDVREITEDVDGWWSDWSSRNEVWRTWSTTPNYDDVTYQRVRTCTNPTPIWQWKYCEWINEEKKVVAEKNIVTVWSGWYGTHYQSVGNRETECSNDWDTTWAQAKFQSDSGWAWLVKDWRVVWYNSSKWQISCQYFDRIAPTLTSTTLPNYSNWSFTYSVAVSDVGWSWIKKIVMTYKNLVTGSTWTLATFNWLQWTSLQGPKNVTKSKIATFGEWKYQMSVTITDVAWNSFTKKDKIILIDKTAPNDSDISGVIKNLNNTYFKATDKKSLSITIDPNRTSTGWLTEGSPIKSFTILVENHTNKDASVPYNFTWGTGTFDGNFSKVDLDRTTNNYREYTVKVVNIYDEAGNKWTGWTYTYKVYANIPDSSTTTVNSDGLTSDDNVADGSLVNFNIKPKDKYWNKIVPVVGVRTVTISPTYKNNVRDDQFRETGYFDSALFGGKDWTTSIPLADSIEKSYLFSNKAEWLDQYTLKYKSYAPTQSAYFRATWVFEINKLNVLVNDTYPLSTSNNINISSFAQVVSKFKPLYTIEFEGDIENNWIIEWATQTSTVDVTKESPAAETDAKLYITYDAAKWILNRMDSGSPVLYSKYTESSPLTSNSEYTLTSNDFNIFTKYVSPVTLDDKNIITVASQIAYKINGLKIVYNSDRIGSSEGEDIALQSWVKISGTTYLDWNETQEKILTNEDVKVVEWNVDKTELKKVIKQNSLTTIKNLTPNTSASTYKIDLNSNPGWVYADNNKNVIYYGDLNGRNVQINSELGVNWNKTIIIKWWNLYIKWNMYYENTTSMISFAVLKDENGKGWNIYIDPIVTNVVGTFYSDGALISYDGADELDWNTNQSILKNQLHIYGTLIANNTVWGSRKATAECPYYIDTCTEVVAQKYDLSYLRRYFLNKDGKPANNPHLVWGGYYNKTTNSITWGSNKFAKYVPNGTNINTWLPIYEDLAYPLMVEYNPNLQLNPSPIFTK